MFSIFLKNMETFTIRIIIMINEILWLSTYFDHSVVKKRSQLKFPELILFLYFTI